MQRKCSILATVSATLALVGCGSSGLTMGTLAKRMENASAVTHVVCVKTGSDTAHCTGVGFNGKPTHTDVVITNNGPGGSALGFELKGLGWTV